MYNSIILFEKGNYLGFKILLSKKEFERIKIKFDWIIGPEGFIISKNDNLSFEDILKLKNEVFPNLFDDFDLNNFDLQFSHCFYPFKRKDIFEQYFCPIQKGPSPYLYGDIVTPVTRPKQIFRNHLSIWYQEYGLFKSKKLSNGHTYFKHPKTHFTLFERESEYDLFLKKRNIEMESAKKKIEDEKEYIRFISVYSKENKKLMYRIVFEEFYQIGLMNLIKPYKGDEVYFFRTYKIDNKLAKYIINESENCLFNFDFEKYEYFLEVMETNEFVYTYKEFAENLEIEK